MPNVIRMFRASDDDLLDEVEAPGDGTYDPAALFDLSSLDEVDVYFEMATEPTGEYTTPAFVAPTIASAHISDTQGGTVITEASVGDVLRAVANGVTGYPSPALTYQWNVNASPAGGTDDEESFDTTGLEDGDVVTVEITATNPEGFDDATSAGVEVTGAPAPLLLADGSFATSTGWDVQNGAAITSGEAQFTYTSGSAAFIRAETTCLPNTTYRMTLNMLQSFSGGAHVLARFARDNVSIAGANTVASEGLGGTTTGLRDFTITTGDWGDDTIYFLITVSGTGGTYRIDDLTMEIDA